MEQLKTFLSDSVVSGCIRLLIAGVIIGVGMWLVGIIMKLLCKSKLFAKIDPSAQGFISSAVGIVLRALVIITAAANLGVPMASVVAVIGSAGVAVGLALQGGLSNIAGGIMILITRPFGVGDYIETGSQSGTVESISIYYTSLITADNKKTVIPNGTITSSTVTNYSAMKTRRIELNFTAAYSCDTDAVKNIIKDAVLSDDRVLQDPEATVCVSALEDSAVKYIARFWVKSSDYWNVYYNVLEKGKKAFDRENIEIPFPQLDVHLGEKY